MAALAVIGYVVYFQKNGYGLSKNSFFNPADVPSEFQTTYQKSGRSISPVKNAGDLNNVSASLDSTDVSQIDAELKALNSASIGF